ncbi:HEPN domain-containing protein [Enterobacter soli]|uniref:HEPN domain-containing protein n=1 Tax=Enterobacter soli TaxID=885040 RepID=UPI001C25A671|nr:hypothetical protein [Enterobacter soli]
MKTEYLITFDSSDCVCADVSAFRSLLSTHKSISFGKGDKISHSGKQYKYQLAQGSLTDDSIYYDLTIEAEATSSEEINEFKKFLKDIRTICSKFSGRDIIILHDGIGEEYCILGYPKIYKTENLMRKLIAKFMAISIGYNWSESNTPKEVLDSVRGEVKKEKTNFLHEVDFIQLSNFLFKKYTKSDAGRFFETIKGKDDSDTFTSKDLKHYVPFTNWEKYFAKKVQCESEYLRTKWEKLYEYRCKIAHCKGISKQELNDLSTISDDICQKIQVALDSIGDLHIEEIEREELAENFSGAASKDSADFISRYYQLANIVLELCKLSSSDNDIFYKSDTNRKNIRMQSKYLCNNKGIITREMADMIDQAHEIRNIVVHKVGLVKLNESEIIKSLESINDLLEEFSLIDKDTLETKKGLDLRNQQ